MPQHLVLNNGELAWLIRSGAVVNVKMGIGPTFPRLEYDDSQPLPEAVEKLLSKRGVLNENCQGAGI